MAIGKVYLIGAGPGDPELITQKAIRVIRDADVLLYDYLVHPNCLNYATPDTAIICVGKRKGQHSKKQHEINDLLVTYAKQGKTVARLKGGDPCVFGRGGEEMEVLVQHQIPYEIIPGVTSAIAVPAYAGIPVTHRDLSRSVAFVTATLKEGQAVEALNLPDADSIVCLMCVTHLAELAAHLQTRARFSADTPAALIHRGTTAYQRTVVGTLSTIAALQKSEAVGAPSLLIVGDVVGVKKQLSWWENTALHGKRFVVTRALTQSQEVMDNLFALGAEVLQLPLFKTVASAAPLTLSQIDKADWLIFTSANGVRHGIEKLLEAGKDLRDLTGKRIIAIGQKTATTLTQCGIRADLVPDIASSEGLLARLPDQLNQVSVAMLTTQIHNETLERVLADRGATVTPIFVYETQAVQSYEGVTIQDDDQVIFASGRAVSFFVEAGYHQQGKFTAIAIGETARQALQNLLPTIPMDSYPSFDSFYKALHN